MGKMVRAISIPSPPSHMVLMKRSEEHTSELQSQSNLVCRLLLEKKKTTIVYYDSTPAHAAHLSLISPQDPQRTARLPLIINPVSLLAHPAFHDLLSYCMTFAKSR